MTLYELKLKIDKLLEEYPRAGDSRVLVDTEARRFHAHMISVENIRFCEETCDFVGDDFSTIYIDLDGAET